MNHINSLANSGKETRKFGLAKRFFGCDRRVIVIEKRVLMVTVEARRRDSVSQQLQARQRRFEVSKLPREQINKSKFLGELHCITLRRQPDHLEPMLVASFSVLYLLSYCTAR